MNSANIAALQDLPNAKRGIAIIRHNGWLLAEALHLASLGLPVFPCSSDKAPLVKGGCHAATTEPAVLRGMFRHPRAAFIGVPTGSRTGFIVIDVDPRHGGDAWLDTNKHRLPIPGCTKHRPAGGTCSSKTFVWYQTASAPSRRASMCAARIGVHSLRHPPATTSRAVAPHCPGAGLAAAVVVGRGQAQTPASGTRPLHPSRRSSPGSAAPARPGAPEPRTAWPEIPGTWDHRMDAGRRFRRRGRAQQGAVH